MPIIARTISLQQYVRLYFEPKKADGTTIGLLDSDDHPITWSVDGVVLGPGMTETGIARINFGGETMDVHAGGPAGDGTQTFEISVTGDADLSDGEVRDVTWNVTLELTVLPDEAVLGDGRVSEALNI